MRTIPDRKRRRSDAGGHPGKRIRTEPKRKLLTNDDYDFGWVAALHIERAAAEAMLDEEHEPLTQKIGDSNNYSFGRIGNHNIVIASLPDDGYGTVNAATVASNMHRTFPGLRGYLVVGIAGGAPENTDVRLGDVVVNTKLVQYDLGKSVGDDKFQWADIPMQATQELRTAVSALKAEHEAKPSKICDTLREVAERKPHMERYTCRQSLGDLLFESTYEHPETEIACDQCDRSRLVERIQRSSDSPVIHYGVIASGNQVIKYAKLRNTLARRFNALCFEMEGAGVIGSLGCLVIRSICDYADSHKNKRWQPYAAATAAAYAKELLGKIPVLEARASKNVEEKSSVDREALMDLLYFDHMHSRGLSIEPAQYNTCRWILDHPVYLEWLKHFGFLWIRGKPGAGKSTLIKFISTYATQSDSIAIAYFFNARGGNLEKSAEGMYRSLLHQLLQKLPNLTSLEHPHIPQKASSTPAQWHIRVLEDLLSRAIAKLGDLSLMCFVDAIDECNESEVRGMVKLFEQLGKSALSNNVKLAICFSSRHYLSISVKAGLTLTLENENGHHQDLENYASQEL
ncbi:pfs domain-containing protein [Xylaria palmicola]|nr:pfs domain-containing protein [Xylaria palmicola]